MGCQQSHLAKEIELEGEIPEKQKKATGRKKPKNDRINGLISLEKIFQNIKKIDFPKQTQDLEFIERAISKHFLLFKLSKQERRQLANAMEAYETDVNEYVFQQGTPASMFFIIQEGEVQIQINNAVVKTMRRGDFFGELAFIYSSPRSASVKVLSKSTFWCLSQHLFLKIQREMVKNNFKIAKQYVSKLPIFNFLTSKQKDAICYNMNTLKYEQGDIVFKVGEDAMSFFIIIEGLIQIDIVGKPAIQLKSGDSFGENCLKPNQIRSGTASCVEKTHLLAISREDLKSCLGGKSEEQLLFNNLIKWSLRRSAYFKQTTSFQQSKMIAMGQVILKKEGEILIQAGDNDENLYICLEGKINAYQVGFLINQEQAIEEIDIFIAKETLIKKENGYVFIVSLKNIQRERNKEKKLKLAESIRRQSKDYIENKSLLGHTRVDFKDLYILCKLGQGHMGKVFLVQNKKTQKRYALKCVEKNMVLKHQMEKFLKCEKEILSICNYPFIVKLIDSFKDTHFVYLLLEYIEGGDFFDFLADIGICNNTTATFYFGCLLLSIEYLHKNSIVYRDLKPENAAVNSNGYLQMIDMGTSKLLIENSETGFRTFTIIGTPHYMAPQVIEAKGYSFSVDIWSLGIILFEMVCGVLPYGSYSDDPVSIYKEIQKNELRFPKNYIDQSGKQLIFRLLQKHPDKRAVDDFSEIKNMDYFKNFNWKLLENQKMVAPLKPKNNQDSKWKEKSQYLLNYLQKEKLKMDRPMIPNNPKWDQNF